MIYHPEITTANKARGSDWGFVEQKRAIDILLYLTRSLSSDSSGNVYRVQKHHGRFWPLEKCLMVWAEEPKSPSEERKTGQPDSAKSRKRRSVSRNN